MAADIEIFDSAGRLSFRATDYLARVMGQVWAGGTDGSFNYTGPDGHRLWAAFLGGAWGNPGVRISGTIIYWNYGNDLARSATGWIIYGLR